MTPPAINHILIELHVPDFKVAKDFYQKLGFSVVWENKSEDLNGYLVMQRDSHILCFWPGNKTVLEQPYFKNFPQNTKRGYGVEIVIMVQDIEEYYEQVKSFANIVEALVKQPWGLKDFRLEDPFGFYLRFTQPHNILDAGNAVK